MQSDHLTEINTRSQMQQIIESGKHIMANCSDKEQDHKNYTLKTLNLKILGNTLWSEFTS